MSSPDLRAHSVPTSGVDGNSEGGRINSVQSEPLLALYAAELSRTMWELGEHGSMAVRPVQQNGIWCFEVTVTADVRSELPVRWYGRRVTVKEVVDLAGTPYRPTRLYASTPRRLLGPTQPAHPGARSASDGRPAPEGTRRDLSERKVDPAGGVRPEPGHHHFFSDAFRMFAQSVHHRPRIAAGHE